MNELRKELKKLLREGMTQEQGFAFFDQLETVDSDFMIGKWKGNEAASGHPMDGLLTVFPWYGKQFIDKETVHPLVFKDKHKEMYYLNPNNVFKLLNVLIKSRFMKKIIQSKRKFNKHKFDCLYKLFKTNSSKARLRQVEYRGRVSASMIYDALGIIDIFRKIDENTIFGVMDMKGEMNNLGYFFILKRIKDRAK